MGSRMILGLSLLFTVLATAIVLLHHGHPRIFWDRASLLIVGGGTFSFLLMNFPAEGILKSFRLALGSSRDASRAELTRAVQFFDSAVRASLMFGVVNVYTGSMLFLTRLDDPKMIAPALALSILGMLYGVVQGEVLFQSLRLQCLRKLGAADEPAPAPTSPAAGQGLGLSLLFVGIGFVPLVLILLLFYALF